jgi:hypothetical protein
LMLAGFELEPHPTRARPPISKASTANCLISNPPGTKSEGRCKARCGNGYSGGLSDASLMIVYPACGAPERGGLDKAIAQGNKVSHPRRLGSALRLQLRQ